LKPGILRVLACAVVLLLLSSFCYANSAVTIVNGGIQFPADGSIQYKSATLPGCSNGGVLVYNSGNWYCGTVMPVTNGIATCVGGVCAVSACMQGFADCDSAPGNGCETSLAAVQSCGGCGVACAASTACTSYSCVNAACTATNAAVGTTCAGGTCNGLGSCVAACSPRTCPQLGIGCGSVGDGCGGTLQCGTCPGGQTCGGGGITGICGTCTPKTCTGLGINCGSASDGCGGSLQCGFCPGGQTCGGGGITGVCK
jgi:hypothetical protein